MKKVIFYSMMALFVMSINACEKDNSSPDSNIQIHGTLIDQDGNVYKTITIGNQTWMAENLRTTKYRDGSAIPEITGNNAWLTLSTGAYCNYNNTNDTDFIATYGRLYNWYAATDSRNLAPVGWHVPTYTDWERLTSYNGGDYNAGGRLKEAGTTHWNYPNTGATNLNSFTALPGGCRRTESDGFDYIGYEGYWWTTTMDIYEGIYCRSMVYHNAINYRFTKDGRNGFSVRCVKD